MCRKSLDIDDDDDGIMYLSTILVEKEEKMKKWMKSLMLVLLIVPIAVVMVACGGKESGGGSLKSMPTKESIGDVVEDADVFGLLTIADKTAWDAGYIGTTETRFTTTTDGYTHVDVKMTGTLTMKGGEDGYSLWERRQTAPNKVNTIIYADGMQQYKYVNSSGTTKTVTTTSSLDLAIPAGNSLAFSIPSYLQDKDMPYASLLNLTYYLTNMSDVECVMGTKGQDTVIGLYFDYYTVKQCVVYTFAFGGILKSVEMYWFQETKNTSGGINQTKVLKTYIKLAPAVLGDVVLPKEIKDCRGLDWADPIE